MKIINTIPAVLQEYTLMGGQWASDLEFYKIESAFLRELLENHFMELCQKKYIDELKQFGFLLMQLDQQEIDCNRLISIQLAKLRLLTKYSLLDNEAELSKTQVEIARIMLNMTYDYRKVKKDIFRLLEGLFKDKKLRKLQLSLLDFSKPYS